MAAAAPLDFNGFLGQIATLGTVNTDGQGFIAAMAYALTEAGRLKSWSRTIRSSLIDNSMYLSTQGLNPVIAVLFDFGVDKSYSGSDYYFLNEYSVDFRLH